MDSTDNSQSVGDVQFAPLARTIIKITGSDRAAFLHNFSTNDIVKMQPGDRCEAFITSVQGKTLGHVVVYCVEEALVLVTADGQQETLINHLDRYIIMEDVELENCSGIASTWLLFGEGIPSVVSELNGVEFMSPYGYCGETCQLLLGDASTAESLEQLQVREASSDQIETLRLEAGFVEFGVDVTEANLPQEVARDAIAISFTKGCYLGQETVARIDALGHVNWLMRTMTGIGLASLNAGDEIAGDDGKKIARLTSCSNASDPNQKIALGYVHKDFAESGATIADGIQVA